ncbi:MAG: hypothetical protein OXH09_03595, partial [Gammaproteobacteria bacterium]|nr:hypothetical protein [Gammaproteobacteria bacterium]
MRQIDCIHALHNHTSDAPPVLTKADLAHLLPHTNQHTFDATLRRLVASVMHELLGQAKAIAFDRQSRFVINFRREGLESPHKRGRADRQPVQAYS